MTDIYNAIKAINPNAKCTIYENDIKKIVWADNKQKISEEDILAKQKELQIEYDKNKYQRDRLEAYPSIPDQLDDLYHNGIDGWKTTIKAIKDKYPKE
jgi:hypothetical protein